MARQHLLAALADLGAVLLQAGQHELIALLHLRPAIARGVARAGVMPLLPVLRRLRRSDGRDEKEGDNENYLAHVLCLRELEPQSGRLYNVFGRRGLPVRLKKMCPDARNPGRLAVLHVHPPKNAKTPASDRRKRS